MGHDTSLGLPRFSHGVVAGKFYPLHMGHDLLIQTAMEQCQNISILLIPRSGEWPSGEKRLAVMRAAYPTATIYKIADLGTDDTDPNSSKLWAEYTRDVLDNQPVDAVFTSETYGKWWARALDAEHVLVDLNRTKRPVSGTMIRRDPYYYWESIHPLARGSYVKKVLLIGPESTGKTTLARHLARHYSTQFVPEYGRIYVEKKGSLERTNYRIIFAEILNRQPRLEDEFVPKASRVAFCDTDLTATSIWYHLWQPNAVGDVLHQAIREEAERRQQTYDLVLITSHSGAPWVDDGLRDQGHTREWFTEQVVSQFASHPNVCVLEEDSWVSRQARAIDAVNQLFVNSSWVPPSAQ